MPSDSDFISLLLLLLFWFNAIFNMLLFPWECMTHLKFWNGTKSSAVQPGKTYLCFPTAQCFHSMASGFPIILELFSLKIFAMLYTERIDQRRGYSAIQLLECILNLVLWIFRFFLFVCLFEQFHICGRFSHFKLSVLQTDAQDTYSLLVDVLPKDTFMSRQVSVPGHAPCSTGETGRAKGEVPFPTCLMVWDLACF